MSLTFTLSEQQSVHVASLKGKITSSPDIEQLNASISALSGNIIFELTELTHINSTGINLFIKTLTRCRVNGHELVLSGINGNVKQLFELAKIDGLFKQFETLEDSINHFKQ